MDDNMQANKQAQPKSPVEMLSSQTQSLSELVEIQKAQNAQITELKQQNLEMVKLLAARPKEQLATDFNHVKIEDINMPLVPW